MTHHLDCCVCVCVCACACPDRGGSAPQLSAPLSASSSPPARARPCGGGGESQSQGQDKREDHAAGATRMQQPVEEPASHLRAHRSFRCCGVRPLSSCFLPPADFFRFLALLCSRASPRAIGGRAVPALAGRRSAARGGGCWPIRSTSTADEERGKLNLSVRACLGIK